VKRFDFNRAMHRVLVFVGGAALFASASLSLMHRVRAAEADAPGITIQTSAAQPREIEQQTQQAIQRQYSAAWSAMKKALSDNRVDLLDAAFVGAARDEFAQQIEQQNRNKMSTRIADRGHQVNAVFYSPEGTAIQLTDNVDLEKQYLANGKVIHTEQRQQQYVVLMTLVEDRWKVRVLQEK
jgi:hypothetical protein